MNIPTTYKNARVKIVDNLPKLSPRWLATWYLGKDLNPVILLESYYVKKLKNADNKDLASNSLMMTLEHEYDEAVLSIELLKEQGYGIDQIKRRMTGFNPVEHHILDAAGGKAHAILTGENKGDYSYYDRMRQMDDALGIDYLSETELECIRRLAGLTFRG